MSAPALLSPSSSRLGLVQIHTAAVLVGFVGLFGKWLPLSPLTITFGRTATGSLALLLVIVATRSRWRILGRRDLLVFLGSGVLLTAHWLAFFHSIQVSTVAVGLLAIALIPLFLTFLEPLFFRERLRRVDVAIAGLVVVGLLLVNPRWQMGDRITQGLLWGIVAALAYAALSLLSRACARRYPPLVVAFYQQAGVALLTLPLFLWHREPVTWRAGLLLVLLGVVFTALAQGLVVASLRQLRAQTASVVISLEPLYGMLFASLLLHEVPSPRTILGAVIICGSVFYASLLPREHPLPPSGEEAVLPS